MTHMPEALFDAMVKATEQNIATLNELVALKSASKSGRERQWSICFSMLRTIQEFQGGRKIKSPVVEGYLEAGKTEVQGLLGAFVRPYMGVANVVRVEKGWGMNGCHTLQDCLAYFTDCNLATLSEMVYTKSTSKTRKTRQAAICTEMVECCREVADVIDWGNDWSHKHSRVKDILDLAKSDASIADAVQVWMDR
jgi:hypothetical protein